MRLEKAKTELQSRINRNGINPLRPDPASVWEVFRDFAHISVPGTFSALRFFAGVSVSSTRDFYHIELGRQFSNQPFATPPWARIRPDRYYMLGINLLYDPEEELIAFIEQRFSCESEPQREFLAQIENLPIFTAGFHFRRPSTYEIITSGKPFEVDEA